MAEEQWIKASAAARLLGVSKSRISHLIARGELETRILPIDRRAVLVNRVQVLALRTPQPGRRKPRALPVRDAREPTGGVEQP